jgi:DNA-binding SARP family transcriptional activator
MFWSRRGASAEGLRAYEQCRRMIARELGVDPSPQTKAAYETLLQSL